MECSIRKHLNGALMLTLRTIKGSELTHEELDNNFVYLQQLAQAAASAASEAALASLTQASADTRYVRTVNLQGPDAAGNVQVELGEGAQTVFDGGTF